MEGTWRRSSERGAYVQRGARAALDGLDKGLDHPSAAYSRRICADSSIVIALHRISQGSGGPKVTAVAGVV